MQPTIDVAERVQSAYSGRGGNDLSRERDKTSDSRIRAVSIDDESSDSAASCSTPPAPAISREQIRLFVLASLTIGLLVSLVLLAVPFLPAITWAVALAILAWPVHRWISHRLSRRGLAAGISTAMVATTILVTSLFVTYQIARETADVALRMETAMPGGVIWDKVTSIAVLGRAVLWMERMGLDAQATASEIISTNVRRASTIAHGSLMGMVQFLLTMFILYYLFRDREKFLDGLRDLLPLSKAETDFLMARAADSVHATLYATVATSIIDSVVFGLTFWATGLPTPVLWSLVMFLLSLMPVLGAGLIWVPATAYLAVKGNWLGLITLVAVGLVTSTLVDNVLYAKLAGDRMRMHNVPVLIAFLGGLVVFGMSGMVLGPVILAVTEAMLELWRRRMAGLSGP